MSVTITSSDNHKIKLVRRLHTHRKNRAAENAFVAEGVRLVEEAVTASWPVDFILYDETLSSRGHALIVTLHSEHGVEVAQIHPQLMAEISDTHTPQGILAVLKKRELPLPIAPGFLILADQIRDPGNMGTLLRTAEAAGADGILLSPGTVDAFAPKVIRSGMGAHFHLPIQHKTWEEIQAIVGDLPVYLADTSAETPLWEANFRKNCALLIGGEAFGASPQGAQLATQRLTIPMQGRAESLNAAIAAAILIAEVLRQRYTPNKEP